MRTTVLAARLSQREWKLCAGISRQWTIDPLRLALLLLVLPSVFPVGAMCCAVWMKQPLGSMSSPSYEITSQPSAHLTAAA